MKIHYQKMNNQITQKSRVDLRKSLEREEFQKLTLDFECDADFFSSNHLFASMTALLDISPTFTSINKRKKML